jgi:hypothetical protein
MAYLDVDLGKLLVTHIDGVPLALASKLLPARTRLSYPLQAHIHLHAKLQSDYADAAGGSAQTNRHQGKQGEAVQWRITGYCGKPCGYRQETGVDASQDRMGRLI